MKQSLHKTLEEWTDWDLTAFRLAVSLGLMEDDIRLFQTRAKHVFWSDNCIGNLLYGMLDSLVAARVLEIREEPDKQYRWNPQFHGCWEAQVEAAMSQPRAAKKESALLASP